MVTHTKTDLTLRSGIAKVLHIEIMVVNADKNPLYQQLFKTSSSNMKKYFDKEVKNYLYGIFGQTSKIILPADDHKELALHQKYLVLHLYVPLG